MGRGWKSKKERRETIWEAAPFMSRKKKRVQDRKLKSLSSSLLFSDFGSRSRGDVDVEGRVSTWVVALAKT